MSTVAAFINWDPDVMAQAGLNTLLGIGIVFCMLLLISFIISCFKMINKLASKAEKPAPAPAAASEPVIAEEEENVDDLEIIAVITAAIEAYEEAAGGYVPEDGLVVRSIRKVNKQRWQNA